VRSRGSQDYEATFSLSFGVDRKRQNLLQENTAIELRISFVNKILRVAFFLLNSERSWKCELFRMIYNPVRESEIHTPCGKYESRRYLRPFRRLPELEWRHKCGLSDFGSFYKSESKSLLSVNLRLTVVFGYHHSVVFKIS